MNLIKRFFTLFAFAIVMSFAPLVIADDFLQSFDANVNSGDTDPPILF